MENILFSLIVPMYNSEKYIEKCLLSILEQTFHEYEVLLIDDASTDNTLALCEKFIDGDSRFRIIKKEKREGVSAARNSGLKVAVGTWVWFIDSDDWIESKSLEIVASYLDDDLDFVGIDVIKERRKYEKTINCLYENNTVVDRTFFGDHIIEGGCHFTLVWSNLFKRNFLIEHNMFFDQELSIMEDYEYITRLGREIRQGKIIRENLYHYVVHMDSASQKWISGSEEQYMNSAEKIYENICNTGSYIAKDLFGRFMQDVTRTIVVKDIFHPDNKIHWRERKQRMRILMKQNLTAKALEIEGSKRNKAKWIVWFAIIHKQYILIGLISWLYYHMESDWFWNLYSKIYRV